MGRYGLISSWKIFYTWQGQIEKLPLGGFSLYDSWYWRFASLTRLRRRIEPTGLQRV